MMKKILIVLLISASMGCDNLFFDESPETEPLEVYDAFVHQLNTNNPFLQYMPIDTDIMFAEQREQIEKHPTGQQLINSIEKILNVLKDAHTGLSYDLQNETMFVSYTKWINKYPDNTLPDITHYFESYSNIGGESIEYGRLKGRNIGYIKINSMHVRGIKDISESFDETEGLILDLRSTYNQFYSSFDYESASDILKMFSDSSRTYLYRRIKSSEEVTSWQTIKVPSIPIGASPVYSNPIVILNNRKTKDAAELLTAALRELPFVTIIGDTTAGFIGVPKFEHVAGKWYMNVSNEEFKLPENYLDSSHRFQGVPPDIAVEISQADSSAGVDTILERAIEELSE